MAISPNDTFTSGQILTAQECNQFPFGVVAIGTATATDNFTSEEVELTTTSFTAIANRYYRVTYFEPKMYRTTGESEVTMRIRLNTIGGAVQQSSIVTVSGTYGQGQSMSLVKTFTAGATVLVSTLEGSGGTNTAERSATSFAYLLVEDIGPA
jgi:hypothetical protein